MLAWQNKLSTIQISLKEKYPDIKNFTFEERIKVQEELYQEAFKDTNIDFLIFTYE